MKAIIKVNIELDNVEKGNQQAINLANMIEAAFGKLIPGRYHPKVSADLEWVE